MTPPHLLPAPPPRQRPAGTLRALAGQLRQRGIGPLYGAACDRFGVLSLPGSVSGPTAASYGGRHDGDETTWPTADTPGAAQRLTTHAHHPSNPQPPDGR